MNPSKQRIANVTTVEKAVKVLRDRYRHYDKGHGLDTVQVARQYELWEQMKAQIAAAGEDVAA